MKLLFCLGLLFSFAAQAAPTTKIDMNQACNDNDPGNDGEFTYQCRSLEAPNRYWAFYQGPGGGSPSIGAILPPTAFYSMSIVRKKCLFGHYKNLRQIKGGYTAEQVLDNGVQVQFTLLKQGQNSLLIAAYDGKVETERLDCDHSPRY